MPLHAACARVLLVWMMVGDRSGAGDGVGGGGLGGGGAIAGPDGDAGWRGIERGNRLLPLGTYIFFM